MINQNDKEILVNKQRERDGIRYPWIRANKQVYELFEGVYVETHKGMQIRKQEIKRENERLEEIRKTYPSYTREDLRS